MRRTVFIIVSASILFFQCKQATEKTNTTEEGAENASANGLSTDQQPSILLEIAKTTETYQTQIDQLAEKQSAETDPVKNFAYDDSIAAVKTKADSSINSIFKTNTDAATLSFKQTANKNRITVNSVKVTSAEHNALSIEASITAIENSATSTPYISISAIRKDGTRLDISGGIGFEGKLVANQSYVFKGKIRNTSQLKGEYYFDFDEEIKKW